MAIHHQVSAALCANSLSQLPLSHLLVSAISPYHQALHCTPLHLTHLLEDISSVLRLVGLRVLPSRHFRLLPET